MSRNHGQGPVLEGKGCFLQVEPGGIGKAAQVLPHTVPRHFSTAKERRMVPCLATPEPRAASPHPTELHSPNVPSPGVGQQHSTTYGTKWRRSLAGVHTVLPCLLQRGRHVLQQRQQAVPQQEEQQLPHALSNLPNSFGDPGLELRGERRDQRLRLGAEQPHTPSPLGTAHPLPSSPIPAARAGTPQPRRGTRSTAC